MAEAVRSGEGGARVNTISPGIVMTPLAKDELSGPIETPGEEAAPASQAESIGINFSERCHNEVRRIPLPRTLVNKGENGRKCVGPRAQSAPHPCYPPY